MSGNNFPINNSNADIIVEATTPESHIVMQKFESIFDFFSEEPSSIVVEAKEGISEDNYICVLRIRIWNAEKKSYSWSVYSPRRHELSGLVIRKTVWNMKQDLKFAMSKVKESRDEVLSSCPSITIYNKYISPLFSNDISQLIASLDSEIGSGFILTENQNPTWEWRDLEILRLYDWGQLHFTWSPNKTNEQVEKKLKSLILNLDTIISEDSDKIFKMKFNYSILPELYLKSINVTVDYK